MPGTGGLRMGTSDDEDDAAEVQALIAAAEAESAKVDEPSAVAYVAACQKAGCAKCSQWHRACQSRAANVSLCHYGLGTRGVSTLCESLALNSAVRVLDLGDNGLGSEGIRLLLEALSGGAAAGLRELSLRQNAAGEEGATALAAFFRSSSSLESLDFGGNAIGNKGAALLAEGLQDGQCALQTLSLEHNQIEDDGAEKLARALGSCTSLTSLSLEWNAISGTGGKAFADALGGSSLQSLNLGWNGLGDAGGEALGMALAAAPQGAAARDIRLHHNRMSATAAVALAHSVGRLSLLDISGNPLGTQGAAVLLLAQQTKPAKPAQPSEGGVLRCKVLMEDVCVRPDTVLAGLLRRAAEGEELTEDALDAGSVRTAAAEATAAAGGAKPGGKGAGRKDDAKGKKGKFVRTDGAKPEIAAPTVR